MAEFEYNLAKRGEQLLRMAFIGPSGGGKTLSAHRVAKGLQTVVGGDIAMIDTEACGGLQYADEFKFFHIPMGPPFSPERFQRAGEFAASKGAKILIVDSFSHEHEGIGGVLEIHAQEVERIGKGRRRDDDDGGSGGLNTWIVPKAMRRAMMQRYTQLRLHLLVTFRAVSKNAMVDDERRPGKKKIENIGWIAVTDQKVMLYEFPTRFLLVGNADGRPIWLSELEGEQSTIRRPKYFRELFREDMQLSESVGAAMGKWALGGKCDGSAIDAHPLEPKLAEWLAGLEAAADLDAVERVIALAEPHRKTMTPNQRARLRAAKAQAETRLVPAGRMSGED